MAKRGQKGLRYEDYITGLESVLSTGVCVRDACAYVGISETTYYGWCKKYAQFAKVTTRARASGRIGAASIVRRAAMDGDVQAAQWYLERTDPTNWGRRDFLTVLGLDASVLKELKRNADAAGVDLATIFEAMVNELGSITNAHKSDRQE